MKIIFHFAVCLFLILVYVSISEARGISYGEAVNLQILEEEQASCKGMGAHLLRRADVMMAGKYPEYRALEEIPWTKDAEGYYHKYYKDRKSILSSISNIRIRLTWDGQYYINKLGRHDVAGALIEKGDWLQLCK